MQNMDALNQFVEIQTRIAFEADRMRNAPCTFDVRAVQWPGSISDPQHVVADAT